MVSTLRLYLLRASYLMVFVFVTTSFWPQLIAQSHHWPLMSGVARCFFAAFAPLTLLGLRYPLKLLPVLLFELTWKTIWVVAIGLPLYRSGQLTPDFAETMRACLFGLVLFPIVIPWKYVVDTYLRAPGDRWGAVPRAAASREALTVR